MGGWASARRLFGSSLGSPAPRARRAAPWRTSLDAAMQALALALREDGDDAYLPIAAARVVWGAERVDAAYGYAALRSADDDGRGFVGDVALLTENGEVIWSASELHVLKAAARAERGPAAVDGLFYEVAFRRAQLPAQRAEKLHCVDRRLGSKRRGEPALLRSLEAAGHQVIHIAYGDHCFDRVSEKSYRIHADDANGIRAVFADIEANE